LRRCCADANSFRSAPPQLPPQPEQLDLGRGKLASFIGQAEQCVQKERALQDDIGPAWLVDERAQAREVLGDALKFLVIERLHRDRSQRKLFQRVRVEPCFEVL